ncbi:MAG: hypothetical protein C4584_00180 [Armatimonadetes bacterium]|nr:MAG: hypothetical protein C4584_00180 [Armatimonadota bacterium]
MVKEQGFGFFDKGFKPQWIKTEDPVLGLVYLGSRNDEVAGVETVWQAARGVVKRIDRRFDNRLTRTIVKASRRQTEHPFFLATVEDKRLTGLIRAVSFIETEGKMRLLQNVIPGKEFDGRLDINYGQKGELISFGVSYGSGDSQAITRDSFRTKRVNVDCGVTIGWAVSLQEPKDMESRRMGQNISTRKGVCYRVNKHLSVIELDAEKTVDTQTSRFHAFFPLRVDLQNYRNVLLSPGTTGWQEVCDLDKIDCRF